MCVRVCEPRDATAARELAEHARAAEPQFQTHFRFRVWQAV